MAYSSVILLSLLLMALLAACSDDGQNADSLSQGGIQRMSRASGKVDGAVLILAKELIASNVNPFLNKLPITADAQAEAQPPAPIEGQEQTVEAPADPFEGVTLVGISYQAKNSYALVSLANGAAAQVVREGDLITTESGSQLKIGKIHQAQIDIRELSGATNRSLALPDIIGFTQTTTGGGDSPGEGHAGSRRGRSSERSGEKGGGEALQQKTTSPPAPDNKAPIIKLED